MLTDENNLNEFSLLNCKYKICFLHWVPKLFTFAWTCDIKGREGQKHRNYE